MSVKRAWRKLFLVIFLNHRGCRNQVFPFESFKRQRARTGTTTIHIYVYIYTIIKWAGSHEAKEHNKLHDPPHTGKESLPLFHFNGRADCGLCCWLMGGRAWVVFVVQKHSSSSRRKAQQEYTREGKEEDGKTHNATNQRKCMSIFVLSQFLLFFPSFPMLCFCALFCRRRRRHLNEWGGRVGIPRAIK